MKPTLRQRSTCYDAVNAPELLAARCVSDRDRSPIRLRLKFHFATIALLASTIALGRGGPIIEPTTYIAPTTNFGQGENLNPGLYGVVYNFNSNAPTINDPDYTFAKILNNVTPTSPASHPFDPVEVGTYVAGTSSGINYGTVNPSDSQLLTTWLGADGASLHPTNLNPVFNTATKTGTLLDLTGYIKITPAMVNVPQNYSFTVDDGGILTINGTPVINQGGIHGVSPNPPIYPVIFTRAGLYTITVGFYDGDAVKAELEASLGGGHLLTTTNGVPLILTPLDPTSTTIQNYVTLVGGKGPSDPTFNNAANALANLAFGADPTPYENALKELSPLKYAGLDSQTIGAIDFITNDLDDYLSHRRTDAGTFRPGNGVDLSGLSVFNGDIDPGLQEIAGHLMAFNGDDHTANILSDSPAGLISAAAKPAMDQQWNFFTRGIVVMSQNLSGGGLQHTDATSGTLQFGADYQISEHLLVGAFFGYAHGSASLDEEGSNASSNSYIPGIYASYTDDGWYANGLVAGGVSDFDVNRNIEFPGFSASTEASPTGEEEYAYFSGGRDYHFKNWTVGPTGGLQYVHSTIDSFTENGAGLLDLNVNSHSEDSLRSRLGGRVYLAAPYGPVLWRPFLDAAWQHEFMENSNSLTAQFDGAGVGTFTVPTPKNSRESALISIGTDIDIDKDTTVFTAYRIEAGESNFFAQSVEAGVKITF